MSVRLSLFLRAISHRWSIEHGRRIPKAQQAYDDFLRGLEIVGAQVNIRVH